VRRYGLLGKKLAHSHSPALFQTIFATEGIRDCTYELIELDSLQELTALLSREAIHGFNVTLPYKSEILPYLNSISPEAKAIGAVNCVKVITNGSALELHGYNTDCKGVQASIRELPERTLTGSVLILGNGGASLAVQYVLATMGLDFQVVTRSPLKPNHLNWNKLAELDWNSISLLINATPLGMYPLTDTFPDLPYLSLPSHTVCWDLIYNPEKTEFMARAAAMGCYTQNGSLMLRIQAEAAWKIWNSTPTIADQ